MKKKLQFYFSFYLGLIFMSPLVIAQNAWEPVKLDVAGHNTVNNVEATFMKGSCNNEEVIFVKFVNRNKYPVTVKWYDAVLTKSNNWVKKDDVSPKKVLTIGAGQEAKGDCAAAESADCVIKLKDYLEKLSDYSLYAIYRFEVLENK